MHWNWSVTQDKVKKGWRLGSFLWSTFQADAKLTT